MAAVKPGPDIFHGAKTIRNLGVPGHGYKNFQGFVVNVKSHGGLNCRDIRRVWGIFEPRENGYTTKKLSKFHLFYQKLITEPSIENIYFYIYTKENWLRP